ncbi:MAG: DUF4338 domain-containing protein [Actinomycetota bacterium]|nr:DUF4338 domain-containing protein [Actinomycetota bacterium]
MTHRYVGRELTDADIDTIRRICADPTYPTRAAIARETCRCLGWVGANGKPKDMSAKVALARMDADGLIDLPAPTHKATRPYRHLQETITPGPEIACRLSELSDIEIALVGRATRASAVWNEMIGRFHYLGYTPASGAQLRYLATTTTGAPIAAISFAASAWALEDRDAWIGWNAEQRKARLHLVVGNPRFLVAPWVAVPNLASHLLAAITRRLRGDWQARYGYAPVLVETFVHSDRHRGTCYQAANWTRVGRTKGRGKLDRYNAYALPVKDIYLYPLARSFRSQLTAPLH